MEWLLTGNHLVVVGGSYLIGSLLAAPWVARRYQLDLRTLGSGNPGFSNLKRQLGWRRAWPALVWDVLKGALAVALGDRFGGQTGAQWGALAVIIGHCFPLPTPWRGGKGVSTFFGAFVVLDWFPALLGALSWLLLAKFVKISSVASLTGVMVTVVACLWVASSATETALLATAIIFVRHRSNLQRLMQGHEPEL